jgi:hypothetical protein
VSAEILKEALAEVERLPALDRLNERFGRFPQQAVADGDYTKREAIVGAAERGVDYYGSWSNIPKVQMKHGIDASCHPSAFQYDEQRNVMICPEARQVQLVATQKSSGRVEDLHLRGRQEGLRGLSETDALHAAEFDGATFPLGEQESRAGGNAPVSRKDDDGRRKGDLQTKGAGCRVSECLVEGQVEMGEDKLERISKGPGRGVMGLPDAQPAPVLQAAAVTDGVSAVRNTRCARSCGIWERSRPANHLR